MQITNTGKNADKCHMLTAYNRFYTHVKVNAQTNHHQTNEQTNKCVEKIVCEKVQ